MDLIVSVPEFTYLLYIRRLLDHWALCSIFENGVLLMYTLEGVSSVCSVFL